MCLTSGAGGAAGVVESTASIGPNFGPVNLRSDSQVKRCGEESRREVTCSQICSAN